MIEVNQLLTAVRSPVTPVQQHRTPGVGHQVGDIDAVLVEVLGRDGGQSVSVVEHGSTRVWMRPLVAARTRRERPPTGPDPSGK